MGTTEEWMSNLPEEVRNMSVINIAIPGSHNSMTYGITSDSTLAPDAEPSVRRMYRIFPCIVRRWARTQSATVQEQLKLGVRYFDLRVAQNNDKFFYVHGLYSMEIFEPLQEIIEFLDNHKGEVVIIDFQHFYALLPRHHMMLHKALKEFFGTRLYTTTDGNGLSDCTLNRCRELDKQIVLIYRRCPLQLPHEFWPSYSWPTPWPNVCSTKKLEKFLQNSLLSRKPSQGYVSQCILTPSGRYIVLRFFSSLKKTAKKVDKKLHPWIEEQKPGPLSPVNNNPTVNVFIADYVNLKDGQFCNWVIALNAKLCDCLVESVE